MTGRSPFDDFRSLLANLPNPDKGALAAAADRRKQLAAGEQMGRIGTIAQWFSGWRGNARQPVMKPLTAVFAGMLLGSVSSTVAQSVDVQVTVVRP